MNFTSSNEFHIDDLFHILCKMACFICLMVCLDQKKEVHKGHKELVFT